MQVPRRRHTRRQRREMRATANDPRRRFVSYRRYADDFETGPLARHAHNLLVARLLMHRHRIAARVFARVVELSDCASRLRHPLPADMPPLVDLAPLPAAIADTGYAKPVLLEIITADPDPDIAASIAALDAHGF